MLYQFKNSDGEVVGTKANPNWIYLQENGYYGICPYEEAQGVAINGTPYNLEGKEPMEGLETVNFEMVDEEDLAQYAEAAKVLLGEVE